MSNAALSIATYRLKWFSKANRECRVEQRFTVPAPQEIDRYLKPSLPVCLRGPFFGIFWSA
jgi:hypothetical protein